MSIGELVSITTRETPLYVIDQARELVLFPQPNGENLQVWLGDFIAACITVSEKHGCPSCRTGTIVVVDPTQLPLSVICGDCGQRHAVSYGEDAEGNIRPVFRDLSSAAA